MFSKSNETLQSFLKIIEAQIKGLWTNDNFSAHVNATD